MCLGGGGEDERCGLRGVHLAATPLILANPLPDGIKITKLIETASSSWGESDTANNKPEKQDGDTQGPITTAVAAEKGSQRFVVIADPVWASNQIVQYGPRNPFTGETVYAQYPANAELTVNAIYWLAGMDQLIAASPRTQDTRRVQEIPETTQIALWTVIIGIIPIACLLAGGIVYFRRNG